MLRTSTALVVVALASVGAGCGDDTTVTKTVTTATDAARTQAEDGAAGLSPQARGLLGDAEALAARTSDTARGYARGDVSPDEASSRLEELGTQAEQLGKKARGLPEDDPARQQIVDLADETRRTAGDLRETAADAGSSPDTAAVEDRLSDLQAEGRQALDTYRDQLPPQARDEIEKAVDGLVSP